LTGDGDLTLDAGIELEYNNPKSGTELSASVYGQGTIGLDNLSALTGGNVIPVLNHGVLSIAADQQVSPEVTLNAKLLWAFREYGDSLMVSGGATIDSKDSKTSFSVGLITPTSDKKQGWMPGGAKKSLVLGFNHTIYTNIDEGKASFLDLNATYMQSLDGDHESIVQTGLAAHFFGASGAFNQLHGRVSFCWCPIVPF